MAAVRRGLHFEVCYAQVLKSTDKGGSRARALFVANLVGLVRATRGRGIVVSSGAGTAVELRGPADIVNLLAVWGLAPDRGTDAMAALPQSIVANEGLRRRGFRGAIDIVQVAGVPEQQKQQQTNSKQAQNQKQKQKRKADPAVHGKPQQAKKQRK